MKTTTCYLYACHSVRDSAPCKGGLPCLTRLRLRRVDLRKRARLKTVFIHCTTFVASATASMSEPTKRKADGGLSTEERCAASHRTATYTSAPAPAAAGGTESLRLDDKNRPTRFVTRRGVDGETQEWMVDATFTPQTKSALIIGVIEALGCVNRKPLPTRESARGH